MSTIQTLPVEVLEAIVQQIDRKTLGECAQVCNVWRFFFIRSLTFIGWCGVWGPTISEYQIKLPRYCLHTLSVDVVPIKKKTVECLDQNDYFFVLEVEILGTWSRKRFKIVFDDDLSSSAINDNDLKDYCLGQNAYCVNITIASLKCFFFG